MKSSARWGFAESLPGRGDRRNPVAPTAFDRWGRTIAQAKTGALLATVHLAVEGRSSEGRHGSDLTVCQATRRELPRTCSLRQGRRSRSRHGTETTRCAAFNERNDTHKGSPRRSGRNDKFIPKSESQACISAVTSQTAIPVERESACRILGHNVLGTASPNGLHSSPRSGLRSCGDHGRWLGEC